MVAAFMQSGLPSIDTIKLFAAVYTVVVIIPVLFFLRALHHKTIDS
jgi:hypothetical protein